MFKAKKYYTFAEHTNLIIILMKKLSFILLVALISLASFGQEQEEGITKGDMELSFTGTITSQVGTDQGYTMGLIFVSYGYYFTNNLLGGIAPGVTVIGSGGDAEAFVSLQLFSAYNFLVDQKFVPYARASLYQAMLNPPEGSNFNDFSYFQAGGGFKYFLMPQLAIDTSLNLGIDFSSDIDGVGILFLTGISYKF
jgi:hypothetical protein